MYIVSKCIVHFIDILVTVIVSMFIKDKFLFRAKHEQEDKIDNEDEANLKPRTDKYGVPLPFVTSPQFCLHNISLRSFDNFVSH